jgi:hypothetical protein
MQFQARATFAGPVSIFGKGGKARTSSVTGVSPIFAEFLD